MRVITLREHKTWEPNKEQEEQVVKWLKNLSSRDRGIIEELRKEGCLEINFDHANEKLKIKANQFIGSAQFDGYGDLEDGFRINIIPKIYQEDTKNVCKKITQIISFADGVSEDDIIESQDIYFEENIEPTLEDNLSYRLVRESDKMLRRGLLKSYVVHTEDTSSLRGKLLLQRQMINDAMRKPQFFCEYDELEYDNIDNRIILQALILCERQTRNPGIKMRALRLREQFSSVVSDVDINQFDIDRATNNYTRQNAHYKNIHKICKLVLKHSGISNFFHGNYSLIEPIFVDMNKKFELFVERLFKKYHGKGKRILVQKTEPGWEVDGDRMKEIIPDIVLMDGTNVVEIIDVKYKPVLHESDLYQIGFYLHEYGKKQKPLEKGFAVLPKYDEAKGGEIIHHNSTNKYIATKTRIKIHEKRIDVDDFLEFMKIKDEQKRKEKLREQVRELITENKSRKKKVLFE